MGDNSKSQEISKGILSISNESDSQKFYGELLDKSQPNKKLKESNDSKNSKQINLTFDYSIPHRNNMEVKSKSQEILKPKGISSNSKHENNSIESVSQKFYGDSDKNQSDKKLKEDNLAFDYSILHIDNMEVNSKSQEISKGILSISKKENNSIESVSQKF